MAEAPSKGLQTIFGFFLGLMVTSFIGVGVYTFFPSPQGPFRDQQVRLNRQEQAIRNSKPANALTPEDRARIQQLQDDLAKVEDASRAASEAWGRRTSIILIVLATVAMAASLIRGLQLPVISSGLLLGGVFAMVYGVGWIIVSDQSRTRFFVMTAALAITLGLGYARFVRSRSASPVSRERIVRSDSLAELEVRVRSLEDRMAVAATAFGRQDGQAGDP
jgi:hypothetical protein